MQTYLVGGAVRDKLLGLTVKDRDWVVVGATPEDLLAQGYIKVGKDFPVFLHPKTKEEYALARTETKTAKGYYGFVCDFGPEVTLEKDLERRDLTINAIAETPEGKIIDPFNGRADLKSRTLRHVSQAFNEDPIRVLRVARFMAKFFKRGFKVDHETKSLMEEIVNKGEIEALVPERVWKEFHKALIEESPRAFFETLKSCGALKHIMEPLNKLWGIPQNIEYHPEVDTGLHTMMVIDEICKLSTDPVVRFAALCHDFGKGLTPKEELPSHRGHEERGVQPIKDWCEQQKTPKAYMDLAVKTSRFHLLSHKAYELKASTIFKLFEKLDAIRRPQILADFLLACEADAKGRGGMEGKDYPQANYLAKLYKAASTLDTEPFLNQNLEGEKLGFLIKEARIKAIREAQTKLKKTV